MKIAILLTVLILTGCQGDRFGDDDAATLPDAKSDVPLLGEQKDAAKETGFAEAGSSDAGLEAEACTQVDHWNGYNTFSNCEAAGSYSTTLALDACNSYFGGGCTVLDTDAGWCTGQNVVGAKSVAWIVWSWDTSSGRTRESSPTPPDCPTPSDVVWY